MNDGCGRCGGGGAQKLGEREAGTGETHAYQTRRPEASADDRTSTNWEVRRGVRFAHFVAQAKN